MLFNSLAFILLFLPVVLVGYYSICHFGKQRWVFLWLIVSSLVFYSVWNPRYVSLLLVSVAANYFIGVVIERLRNRGSLVQANGALVFGIVLNLCVLGWFKYANFFADNINALGGSIYLEKIVLPLAISFYTFQQIAFLVDLARGDIRTGGLARYGTFVIFFPQLIAGPIVHYKEMMPQFLGRNIGRFCRANIVVGTTIFFIGLFKKTVIADSAALYATPVFEASAAGEPIEFVAAWVAAFTYTVQLYFDFSGYSDMAIGLARMFGIRLPVNFHSPLRASSIIEYWRRWHITLQRFIVAYMFQPLAIPLSRFAAARRLGKWNSFLVSVMAPTVLVFVLVGFWHGAAWTFVIFGLMHGIYIAINELWRLLRRKSRRQRETPKWVVLSYHVLTLLAVVVANVMFRAESPLSAYSIWMGMIRVDELGTLTQVWPARLSDIILAPWCFLAICSVVIFLCPNSQQFLGRYNPVLSWGRWKYVAQPTLQMCWRPTILWAVLSGAVALLALTFVLRGQSEFIYFNF